MTIRYQKLTRKNQRELIFGTSISEHGINFYKLKNGDGKYSINIMVDGVRIHRVVGHESEGVTRRTVEQYIEKVKTESRENRLNLPKKRKNHLSFAAAADKYIDKLKLESGKDIPKKKQRLTAHLIPFFKSKPLTKITNFDIERYKKQRLEQNAANGTINRELAVLSHLINKAVEWSWVSSSTLKIKKLKEDTGRITYLTVEQIKRLIDAAIEDQNPYIYPFIIIGLETAMRRSEILSIRLQDIDTDKRIIFIPNAKAGSREQPITNFLADFLQGYITAAEPDQYWLFPSTNSKCGHMVNPEKPWLRVIKAAGLNPKEIVRHTLRHTAISHLVQSGVDLPTVQRISGHKTLSMVLRYSHQNPEHVQAAMDKLEHRYRGLKAK